MVIAFASRRRLRAASLFAACALLGLSACGDTTPSPAAEEGIAQAAPNADNVFACGQPARAIAGLPRTSGSGIAELARVELEGVVVGNFQGGLGGVYVQAETPDDDPATPEGAFVEYRGERPAAKAGRRLRVRGIWSRSDDARDANWALREIDQVLDCGTASPPDAHAIASAPLDWARYSGMRVRLQGPLVVTGNEGLLRFGELILAFDQRLYAATETALPGAAAIAASADNERRSLVIDDGRGGDYPRRLWQLPQAPTAAGPYRVGSWVRGVEGIIEYRHGSWRLQLTKAISGVEQAPRPLPPVRDPSLLRVGSFNVLNYFNGDGGGGGFPTERGAASAESQRRQRDKLIAAMRALDADVLALMEVENDGYGSASALAELAAALTPPPPRGRARNGANAAALWTHIDGGRPSLGSDVIAVGLLYRSDRVRPRGAALTLDGAPFDSDSRMPLAQAFEPVAGGAPFLVVVNHFKSKGGCEEADERNADRGDGQACYAAARVASARRLSEWLRADPAGIGAGQVLILGDLNAHSREDPLRLLAENGFVAVTGVASETPGYSYVFRGQAGRLDHALGGPELAARVRAAGTWAINADELPEFAYDGDARSGLRLYAADPYRSSDHDPVYVDLAP